MSTKNINKIKIPTSILENISKSYIKENLDKIFIDYGNICEFYKNIDNYRKERYIYLKNKDLYYDFETGNIFPNINTYKSNEEKEFSGFQGKYMEKKERESIRATFPKEVHIFVNGSVKKSGDGKTWESAFKTIGEGIRAAKHMDNIVVAEGEYPEKVVLKSNISIYGGYTPGENIFFKSPDKGKSTLIKKMVSIENKKNILISNISITVGSEKSKSALYILSSIDIEFSEIKISDNHFNGCGASPKGICIEDSNVKFFKSNIIDNSVTYNSSTSIYGGAIYI